MPALESLALEIIGMEIAGGNKPGTKNRIRIQTAGFFLDL